MKTSLRIAVCLLVLVFLTVPLVAVTAQGDFAPPLLIVTSKDSGNPALFQFVPAGEEADSAKLVKQANIPAGTTDATVYVAFKSTGWWTKATLGLLSGQLVRENQYVALAVDASGAPVAGPAFALKYRAGYFLLPAVIQEPVRLGVFQIVTEGGTTVAGKTAVLDGTTITVTDAEFQIDPVSPLGNIILDCHITAR